MNKAASAVYAAIRRDGNQANVIGMMQTRRELYDSIGYDAFEDQLNKQFAKQKQDRSVG
jgi:methylisocitrate lyase